MKYLLTIAIAISSLQAVAAPSEYCQASKKTTSQVEQLRFSELPYVIVESKIIKALTQDKCIVARLANEEIYTLSQILLDFQYNEDTAKQIISEFLAL